MSTYAKRYPKKWKHLYNSAAWKSLRLSQLRREPLCRMCAEMGRLSAATVADHVIPHRGDESLFYDSENLQSLDKQCHDSAKQKAERRGAQDIGSTKTGTPRDPDHHWNK